MGSGEREGGRRRETVGEGGSEGEGGRQWVREGDSG